MTLTMQNHVLSLLKRNASSSSTELNFQKAVAALNRLQSTRSVTQSVAERVLSGNQQSKNKEETVKFLTRCGLSVEDFERRVSVIHVAGTKGKGSTSALCESILRAHGFKTGLFTSPHLVSVRERIRINGEPLAREAFTSYFWSIHDILENNKDTPDDMPSYFKFLTVMAFKVFLNEKVDVAVIEVGIGGEHDCTNVLQRTPIVGITSLGYDHMSILGNTLESIAWQKAGIMKDGCLALTSEGQNQAALNVLETRAKEKNATLKVVPSFSWYQSNAFNASQILRLNAPLAVELSRAWIAHNSSSRNTQPSPVIDDRTETALKKCEWWGRFQVLKHGKHSLYLDGAHTKESSILCSDWFMSSVPDGKRKVLVFNKTHNRDSETLLKPLVPCNFDEIIFCPNILSSNDQQNPDIFNCSLTKESMVKTLNENRQTWEDLCSSKPCQVSVYTSVSEALSAIDKQGESHVLITGSLHLVGTVLSAINFKV